MTVVVRKPVPPDCTRLAAMMRAGDKAECVAMGLHPSVALADAVAASRHAYTAEEDGEVLAMWGYGAEAFFAEVAQVWLLTGQGMERHKRLFLRLNREFIAGVLRRHPLVVGHVDPAYRAAVRWMAWLGFQPGGTVSFNGAPFLEMTIRRQ